MKNDSSKDKQYKKFKKLPEDWRNASMGSNPAKIYQDIAQRAINLVTLETAKTLDEDLQRLKEELATANEQLHAGQEV